MTLELNSIYGNPITQEFFISPYALSFYTDCYNQIDYTNHMCNFIITLKI